jgi:hypothetical protein
VELELRDLAGNRTLVGPYPIRVQNAPPAASPPRPGRLTLSRYAVRSKYGGRAVLEGTLVDFAKAPLTGTQIEVAARPLMRNAVFETVAPVVTDAQGHFTVAVPVGTSRTFRLRYASSEVSADVVIPAPVKLKVSPKKTRNRRSVRFTGSIPKRTPERAWNCKRVPADGGCPSGRQRLQTDVSVPATSSRAPSGRSGTSFAPS